MLHYICSNQIDVISIYMLYTLILSCIQGTKAAVSGSLVVRQQPELPGAGKLWPDIENNQRLKPLQVSKEYPHKITSY